MDNHYSQDEDLRLMQFRAKQAATTMDYGIPPEEERLTDTEIAELIAELESSTDAWKRRQILWIFRWLDPRPRRRQAVEECLHEPDSTLAETALEVLCEYWGLESEYTADLRDFLAGVPWDVVGYLRSRALYISGHYLRQNRNPQLLSEMIDLCELSRKQEWIETIRTGTQFACNSLRSALGLDFELPDEETLERARVRLPQEEQAGEQETS